MTLGVSAEAPMVGVFDGDDARERGVGLGCRRTCDLARASRSCSGARLEAGRSTVRGGMRGDGHELSILIRLGDGERQGRGPSNVSTMIIRPPRRGNAAQARRLPPDCRPRAKAGAHSLAASSCRARSMLSARTAPANRP